MIEIQNVSKQFGSQKVLHQLNFRIPSGARMCIVGKSGSGKSVLIKLILGLEEIDSGHILVDDQNVSDMNSRQLQSMLSRFGVVFQGAALFDSMSILENVGLQLFEEGKLSTDEIQTRVVNALKKVKLSSDILHKYPDQLSGGMRKRVGISRAIIVEPQYLIYDEPTTGLDPVSSDTIDSLILNLALDSARTSIIITHDMKTVKEIASHVVMLHETRIIFEGTRDEFLASSIPEVQEFLKR